MRRMLLVLVAVGCGDNYAPEAQLAVTTLVDINPDPSIVEVELVATVGRFEYVAGASTEVWAYRDDPDITPLLANQGDVAIWHLEDDVGMDHPFHLHGMFFQVLDVNDVPPVHRGWKDTVIVPRSSRLRFAVHYGEPGHWMYHCHILEHQEHGMMGVLTLAP